MAGMMLEGIKIPSSLYNGPEDMEYTGRGIFQINSTYYMFCKEGKEIQNFFDSNLKKHLERIKTLGNDELILLDVGSGEGSMLNGLLNNPDLLKQSRQFLKENPDFKITAIGLTDSPDESHQGKEKPITFKKNSLNETNSLINKQIKVKNYFWTLSGRQNLSMFFDYISLDRVDLVYATAVFQYLSPNVFSEVIDTISGNLSIGGQLFCSRFSGAPHGFIPYKTEFTGNTNFSSKENSWKELVRKCSIQEEIKIDSFLNAMDYNDLQTDLEKAIDFYIRIGVLDQKTIEEIELNALKYFKDSDTKKEILQKRAYKILNKAALHLEYLQGEKEHQKKIDLLKKKQGTSIDFFDYNLGFILTKE